ncbi:integrase [Lentibacillus lipolyticus]|nr:integrase [Lentibacillus lipolyticus]
MKEKYWVTTNQALDDHTREVMNEYLLSLKVANKAEATIDKYKKILERFFIDCRIPLESLTSEDVRKWLNAYAKGRSEKTMALVLSTLSTFFAFCQAEDYLDYTLVIKSRWRPKLPKSLPRYLDDAEVAKLKRAIETLPVRDRAIVLFLLTSGCRRSEVSRLNVEDVNLDKRTANVVGKGKKVRKVHFSEECGLVLRDYLRSRPKKGDAFFLNRFEERLQPMGIYKITRKLGEKAELLQRMSPHQLRHTFATTMLSKGADLSFIGDEMGHEDLNTTRVYAQIPTEEMMTAYKKIME